MTLKLIMSIFRYCYDFSVAIITGNKYPVKVCGLCKKEGHARTKCPEDAKTLELEPLPPFTIQLKQMLDRVCYSMYGKLKFKNGEKLQLHLSKRKLNFFLYFILTLKTECIAFQCRL